MPVDARRLIRKMRGGAQAHLIEAADGHCYVVKFLNNPQHRRILVNEWIASVFLRYLGISSGSTVDVVDYPDSKKVAMAAGVKNADFKTATYVALGRVSPADYYDGEDA